MVLPIFAQVYYKTMDYVMMLQGTEGRKSFDRNIGHLPFWQLAWDLGAQNLVVGSLVVLKGFKWAHQFMCWGSIHWE